MVNSATLPRIPLDKWANSFVDYMIDSFSGVFTGINQIMTSLISSLEWALTASPPLVTVVVFVLLAAMVNRLEDSCVYVFWFTSYY